MRWPPIAMLARRQKLDCGMASPKSNPAPIETDTPRIFVLAVFVVRCATHSRSVPTRFHLARVGARRPERVPNRRRKADPFGPTVHADPAAAEASGCGAAGRCPMEFGSGAFCKRRGVISVDPAGAIGGLVFLLQVLTIRRVHVPCGSAVPHGHHRRLRPSKPLPGERERKVRAEGVLCSVASASGMQESSRSSWWPNAQVADQHAIVRIGGKVLVLLAAEIRKCHRHRSAAGGERQRQGHLAPVCGVLRLDIPLAQLAPAEADVALRGRLRSPRPVARAPERSCRRASPAGPGAACQ